MKKKVKIGAAIFVLLILLFPIRTQLKDGGTVEYTAILYKVSDVKTLISEEEMKEDGKLTPYDQGIIIEILGFEIFNNVR